MTTVLIADDEKDIRSALKIYLKPEGYELLEAADGKQALQMVKEKKVDLVLLDIMMPQMNGYEATKAIRSLDDRPDGHTIPIIAMTANAFAEDVQASLDAGMNGHLSKPIVMDEVIKAIARNLN